MLGRLLSVWFWFGSDRRGFCLGTFSLLTLLLLIYAGGLQANLSLGPGGDFPRFRGKLEMNCFACFPVNLLFNNFQLFLFSSDVFLYALSHDDLISLLVSVALLLLLGPCQERRWGTAAFFALSVLTMTILPLLYSLVLFVGGGEASRICGYSAVQLALFTAQCRQVTQRRLCRCLPVWCLPWLLLLIGLLLLPGTPALLHFCAIFIGHNCILSLDACAIFFPQHSTIYFLLMDTLKPMYHHSDLINCSSTFSSCVKLLQVELFSCSKSRSRMYISVFIIISEIIFYSWTQIYASVVLFPYKIQ